MENFQEIYKEEEINIKEIFFKILRYWYLFIIFPALTFVFAHFYNKFAQPVYQNSTTVLISDDEKGSSMAGTKDMTQGFGLFFSGKNVENELIVLQSYSLMKKTIDISDLNVSYYEKVPFFKKDLYKKSPFDVNFDKNKNQIANINFELKILSQDSFNLKFENDIKEIPIYNFSKNRNIKKIENFIFNKDFAFGDSIKNDNFNFNIVINKEIDLENEDNEINKIYFFKINSLANLIAEYRSKVSVSTVSEEASVVRISMTDKSLQRTVDVLNKLTKVYLDRNLNKKNKIATNTVNFINNLLTEITDSLSFTETKLQDFRRENRVMDISFKAKGIYEKMQKLETQRAELLVKDKYYNYLRDYFNKYKDVSDILAPSSMGISDKLLNSLILSLTQISAEKEALSTSKEKNPLVQKLNKKLQNIKKTILENLNNILQNSNISIKDIDNRMVELEKEIGQLPETERKLFKIQRQFKLNDAIYTYLLQKRAEAQIAKASNIPDNEVIDFANVMVGSVISPKKRVNYLIAIFFGLIIPLIFVFIKEFLNDKIIDKGELEKITKFPIIGHIFNNNKKSNLLVGKHPKSRGTESFRSVRTNLQFFSKGKDDKKTILLTSSIGGEGKTFVAINLATSYAQINKKVLLIGFDLRKPKFQEVFEEDGIKLNMEDEEYVKKGITNFLINTNKEKKISNFIEKIKIKEVVQKSDRKPKIIELDILFSGDDPPNPLELIMSDETKKMMEDLKKEYDIIIIDTPPIGVVSDTHILDNFSDINIYVVRQNYTKKSIFENTIKDIEKNINKNKGKFDKYTVLINDVKLSTYNHYGYSYGYGHGYYDDDKKKIIDRLKFWKKETKKKKANNDEEKENNET